MNEIKLSGHVANTYMNYKTDALITTIYVFHDHVVGNQTMRCESKFTVVMTDYSKIKDVDIKKDDDVIVYGYLKEDVSPSNHKKCMIYATDIRRI